MEYELWLSGRADRICAPECQYEPDIAIAGRQCGRTELFLVGGAPCRIGGATHHWSFQRPHMDETRAAYPVHFGRRRAGRVGAGAHAQRRNIYHADVAAAFCRHHAALYGYVVQCDHAAFPRTGGRHAGRYAENKRLFGTDLFNQLRCGSGVGVAVCAGALVRAEQPINARRPHPRLGSVVILHRWRYLAGYRIDYGHKNQRIPSGTVS